MQIHITDAIWNRIERIDIGPYQISKLCVKPCRHYVKRKDSTELKVMLGKQIYDLLQKEGLSHSHFSWCNCFGCL